MPLQMKRVVCAETLKHHNNHTAGRTSVEMRTRLIVCIVIALLAGCASMGILSSAESEFETGLGFFNRGQYDEAIPYFTKAIELDVNYVNAYIYLGRSHLNMGRWAQAIQPLRTAYRLSPSKTQGEVLNFLIDALLGAAVSDFKNGNFSGAIGYLKEGLGLDSGSKKILSQLVAVLIAQGRELLTQGQVRDAITSFSEAIRLSPERGDAYLGLARAFFKEGDLLKALDAVEKALRVDPSNSDAELLKKELKIMP